MIVSEDGVIYADKPTPNLENLPLSTGKQRGYVITELGGEQYFVAYRRSPDSGWTYLNLTPFRQIFEQILFIKELVVFVFVGIFLVVIVLVLRFSRNITHPIYDLIGRMKLAEKGNFEEANFAPAGEGPVVMNEIGLLQRTFRLMIERINRLIKENYSNRLLIKETEFKALQAQINPHFLYNTLESINWMAKVNKQDRISTMVEALAFLLRQSVDMKRPMITLEEELDIVRSYVTIQTIRFEERLDFRLDVPERFFRLALPKLTLQPLLENAIHYALEPTIEPCRITLRAWETDSDIRLAVEDTGPGIPAGTLERLKSGELPTKGKGIGLLNIDERIKIAFGEEYGIRLENTEGGGARVILALPRDKEE
ncbi:sensor histidine kinase [Paenibacillus sp. CC-CFT747]|nr:sensor histidine kinase [Paenibacillus sp. CC-CFT747]